MDSMGQESEELKRLREELTEFKRTASLAESTKQEEIGRLKQKYEDEIQSLNYILKETVADALHTGDHERNELRKKNQMLELQLHDLKQHLNSSDSDSLISHVFRTLKSPSSKFRNYILDVEMRILNNWFLKFNSICARIL